MMVQRFAAHSAAPLVVLFAISILLFAGNLVILMPPGAGLGSLLGPDPNDTAQLIAHYTLLPRVVIGLMAGAGLGLAGALFQRILRNALAEPATLGISAGAQLFLTIATLYAPAALLHWREWIALAGAGLSLSAILLLSWRKGFSPVTVTLAGMIVSLYCAAIGGMLALFNHEFLTSIFLWGAGYLDQHDWSGVLYLAPRLSTLFLVSLFLVRPLALLSVDDAGARSLGLSLFSFRIIALAIAAALTAVVTVSVGIIGFAGLAAPALARASGARKPGVHICASAVSGALLLTIADQVALLLSGAYQSFPTGALTAVLGAPILFLLIHRLRLSVPHQDVSSSLQARAMRPGILMITLALIAVGCFLGSLIFGKGVEGWSLNITGDFIHLRWPRAVAAFCGGAMLALAGAILQRLTANPMASPEVLGVSSGAMLAIILLLVSASSPTRMEQIAAGAAGAFLVLALVVALSRLASFTGERLLLVGVVFGSVSGFAVAMLMTTRDPRLGQVLVWLSGSTYAVRPGEAVLATAIMLSGMICIPFLHRWLDLLPLGHGVARATGVPVARGRNILLSLSALLTASATILVGPLSFAGLMGPHIARLCGFQRAGSFLLVSTLFGGLVLLVADWLGRNIFFPFQIPAGLLATMAGGPFLLVLIARRS